MDIIPKVALIFTFLFVPWLLYQLIKLSASVISDERTIAKLEEEYAELLSSRSDLISQYHWGISSGERDNESNLKRQIVRATKEIMRLRDEYTEKFESKGKAKFN